MVKNNNLLAVQNFEEFRKLGVEPKFNTEVPITQPVFQGLLQILINCYDKGVLDTVKIVSEKDEDNPDQAKTKFVPELALTKEAYVCKELIHELQNALVRLYNNDPSSFMTKEEIERLTKAGDHAREVQKGIERFKKENKIK